MSQFGRLEFCLGGLNPPEPPWRRDCRNENKRKVSWNVIDDGIECHCRSHAIYRSSLVTSFRFTNLICVIMFQSSSIRWTAYGQSLKIRPEERYWSFVSSLHLFEDSSMLTDGDLPSNYLFLSAWKESRAGFTYRLSRLKPRATRSKGVSS